MKLNQIALTLTAAGWLWFCPSSSVRAAETATAPQPVVELAILLDTSSSMDGLIDQARGQLWKIVNEFIKARQRGQQPEVRVALFEYGKSALASADGYLRLIQPLTNDLDRISEDLFALKTNGGEEYCGWVIREAINRLAWSSSPDVYRAIFIAGNEPFTQGPVSYVDSCKAAIAKGIIVNTIFCGSATEGVNTKWQDGALLADGKYMVIDQNHAVVHFDAPQDKEIAQLSVELNKTYVAYGRLGAESAMRQNAQDANAVAAASGGAAIARALTKSSANYRNDVWDLVDAVNNNSRQLKDLKAEELPAEMQAMNETQRLEFLAAKAKARAQIQEKIQKLNAERNSYLASQAKTQAVTNTLDAVVTAAIREQASKKNYQFK